MTYEKKPCPICGKEVSTHHIAQMNHMKTHEPKDEQPEPAQVSGESDATVSRVASGLEIIEKVADPELQQRMRTALEAQQRFAVAPQVFVASQTSDEMLELRKMYLPESLGKHPTKACKFGEARDASRDAARGYMPVIDPATNAQVPLNELLMYWRPIEMARAEERRYQEESRQRIDRAANLKNTGVKANTVGGDPVSVSRLRVEEYSRKEQVGIT